MCLYPEIMLNPKYRANKKNKGVIPLMRDPRVKYVPIGCQECIECRKQKARSWQVRLLEDIKQHRNGKFVTFTFSDESIAELCEHYITKKTNKGIKYEIQIKELSGYEKDNAIATKAMRLFNERWRKTYGKAIRHWMVTELGHNGTKNIHIHGIVWTNESLNNVEAHWKYGFVWKGKTMQGRIINYVNERTVTYIVKYVNKIDEENRLYKSKILTSPGIGANYIGKHDWKKNKFNGKQTIETYRTSTGHKIAMPIYWRNKTWSEEEREQLWIFKLDKQERWVCGERVDISNGEEEYYQLLKHYRHKNRLLGYGDGKKNWERQQYEEQRRELMIKKRLERAAA